MSYSVNGNSCNYVTLTDYNSSSPGMLGQPAVPATTVTGHYVVPDYKPITYDALTHGDGNHYGCSGYFNVTKGYGADAANCNTQYSQSTCNGTVGGGANKFSLISNSCCGKSCNPKSTKITNCACRNCVNSKWTQ